MTFNNTQPVPTEKMLAELLKEVKMGNEDLRQKERNSFLDRYTGKNITGWIAPFFDAKTTLTIVSIAGHNIIKHVVNRESTVYKDPPDYTYDPDALPDDYDQNERWMSFKKAERRTRVVGTGLIETVWRDDRLQWDYIHDYRILTTTNPFEPSAILYPVNLHTGSLNLHEVEWIYWDAERHFVISSKGVKKAPLGREDMINPYKTLPFTSVHPDFQDTGYWVETPNGDTINVMDAFNKGVTEMRLGVRYAAGQKVVTGNNSDKNLDVGIEFILDLSPDATYEHKATNIDFEGQIKALAFDLDTVLRAHGMSAEIADNDSAPSGFSLIVRSIPLLENREDEIGRWRQYDKDVYAIDQIVYETQTKKKLPETRRTDYPEVTFPMTQAEQQAQDDWDLAHGMTTEAKIKMRRDPDGFEDEAAAQKEIDENKANTVTTQPRQGRFNREIKDNAT